MSGDARTIRMNATAATPSFPPINAIARIARHEDIPRHRKAQSTRKIPQTPSLKEHTPMDRDTAEHFYTWLDANVRDSEQHTVEQQIHALLRDYPNMINTHTWSEMRTFSEDYPI
jgi:hypothetical protein